MAAGVNAIAVHRPGATSDSTPQFIEKVVLVID